MKQKKHILIILGCLAVIAPLAVAAALHHRHASPLPASITDKLDFSYATPSGNYKIVPGSSSYLSQSGILIYKVSQSNSGNLLTVSQQSTPQVFKDSSQVYPSLLQKMHEYDEIQTGAGTVALTRPQELSGAQTAVINTSNNLMLVRADAALSTSQWTNFFDSLEWR